MFLLQRQVTVAVLIVALAFLITWVIPNQIITVLIIKFHGSNDGAALMLRATMSLGALLKKAKLLNSEISCRHHCSIQQLRQLLRLRAQTSHF